MLRLTSSAASTRVLHSCIDRCSIAQSFTASCAARLLQSCEQQRVQQQRCYTSRSGCAVHPQPQLQQQLQRYHLRRFTSSTRKLNQNATATDTIKSNPDQISLESTSEKQAATSITATTATAAISTPIVRYMCVVEYHGSRYRGWSRSSSLDTNLSVSASIEHAITSIIGERGRPVKIIGSGRTDSGVHALGQVFHVDIDRGLDKYGHPHLIMSSMKFRRGVNHYLRVNGHAGRIELKHVSIVPSQFTHDDEITMPHARHSAMMRHYKYRILITQQQSLHHRHARETSIFDRDRMWSVPLLAADRGVDLESMQRACEIFTGRHDFAAFQSTGCQATSSVRSMQATMVVEGESAAWTNVQRSNGSLTSDAALTSTSTDNHPSSSPQSPSTQSSSTAASPPPPPLHITFHFSSRSFLYHQIRNMTGLLVAIGRGLVKLEQLKRALCEVEDVKQKEKEWIQIRRMIGFHSAPSNGLFLTHVEYPWDIFEWKDEVDYDALQKEKHKIQPQQQGTGNEEKPTEQA